MSGKRALAIVVVIVVVAAVAAGIAIIGSPGEERTRRLDDRRIDDLRALSQSVEVYYARQQSLPASLDALASEPGLSTVPRDPVAGEPYAYRPVGGSRYELCAVFDRETENTRAAGFWAHGSGRHCFTLDADVRRTRPPGGRSE
jgi:type II secretory pathway pseudopilin PulG